MVKEKADAAAAKHGVKAYYSLKEMLANEELDIVDVTTGGYENGSWHFEPAMEALAAGKHVLCEKPLSNDIGEAREMVRYAAEKRLYLGCNLNHYFTPTAERAKQVHGRRADRRDWSTCSSRWASTAARRPTAFNKSPRFNQPYAHMKAFLTHPFSVMRYFCGDITHVQTFSTKPGFRKNKGDLLLSVNSVHVRFANDTVGYLLSQRGDAVWGLGGWWSCEVAGSKGTFCIENCIEKLTYWPAPKPGETFGLGEAPDAGSPGHRHQGFRRDVPAPHPRLPGGRDQRRAARASALLGPRRAGDAGVHLGGHRVLRERRRAGPAASAAGDPRRSRGGADLTS